MVDLGMKHAEIAALYGASVRWVTNALRDARKVAAIGTITPVPTPSPEPVAEAVIVVDDVAETFDVPATPATHEVLRVLERTCAKVLWPSTSGSILRLSRRRAALFRTDARCEPKGPAGVFMSGPRHDLILVPCVPGRQDASMTDAASDRAAWASAFADELVGVEHIDMDDVPDDVPVSMAPASRLARAQEKARGRAQRARAKARGRTSSMPAIAQGLRSILPSARSTSGSGMASPSTRSPSASSRSSGRP